LKRTIFEIIFTGNELINGKILNTNSKWLAKRITGLGGKITRMIIVPDELKIISDSIKEALIREPDFIITSGGLGSTYDDMTYQAISNALGIPLKLNAEALKYIEEKYEFAQKAGIIKDGSLNKYRKKMAYVPDNASILYNPIGAAPGALIKSQNTQIICLPGVPAELKSIFRTAVTDIIRKDIGGIQFVEKSVYSINFIESEITHVVDRVMNEINKESNDKTKISLTTKSPKIWIKTLVKAPYKKIIIEYHVSCLGPSKFASQQVERAIDLLKKYIKAEGGKCYKADEI